MWSGGDPGSVAGTAPPAGTWSSGLVTPEGVVLEFDTASAPSRAIALLLDLLVALVVVLAVLLLAAVVPGAPGWLVPVAGGTAVFVVLFVVPAVCEARWRGRTLGKAAVGLRVVTVEGAPVRFRHSAIRAALSVLDVWLVPVGAVGLLAIAAGRRDQRLGDLAAGTLVLRTRTAATPFAAVAFPPPAGLEAYAATLDVGVLTADQYLVIRSFLLRAPSLGLPGRAHLGRLVAGEVSARLRHLPPPGVHPEAFLACVAHAYQRRAAVVGRP